MIVDRPAQSMIQSCKISGSLCRFLEDGSVDNPNKANIIAIKVNWT